MWTGPVPTTYPRTSALSPLSFMSRTHEAASRYLCPIPPQTPLTTPIMLQLLLEGENRGEGAQWSYLNHSNNHSSSSNYCVHNLCEPVSDVPHWWGRGFLIHHQKTSTFRTVGCTNTDYYTSWRVVLYVSSPWVLKGCEGVPKLVREVKPKIWSSICNREVVSVQLHTHCQWCSSESRNRVWGSFSLGSWGTELKGWYCNSITYSLWMH